MMSHIIIGFVILVTFLTLLWNEEQMKVEREYEESLIETEEMLMMLMLELEKEKERS